MASENKTLFHRFKRIAAVYGLGMYKPLVDGKVQPGFTLRYHIQTFPVYFLVVILLPFLEVVELFFCEDFFAYATTLCFAMVCTPLALKGVILRYNNEGFQRLAYKLEHQMVQDYCTQESDHKLVKKNARNAELFHSYYFWIVITVVLLSALAPLQNQINSKGSSDGRRPKPTPMYFPFYDESIIAFVVGYAYGVIGILFIGNFAGTVECFVTAIMMQIKCQIIILQRSVTNLEKRTFERMLKDVCHTEEEITLRDNLETLEKNELEKLTMERFSVEDVKEEMYQSLRSCIIHHIDIIECIQHFEDAYHLGFLAHLSAGLGHICITLLVIASTPITSLWTLNAIAISMGVEFMEFLECWSGNEITVYAHQLSESIYDCEWHTKDSRFKRLLGLMLQRSQLPIQLTAGKFIFMSLATFLRMCKGAYSYFAVINNVNKV